MKKSLQYPISGGEHIGAIDTTTTFATTNWSNLTSGDFQSSSTDALVPSGQAFSDLTVYNASLNTAFVKFRGKIANNDPTTNEIPVLAGGVLSLNVQGLKSGNVTSISFKKGAAADKVIFVASFNHVEG